MDNRDLFISPKRMRSFIDSNINRMLKDEDFTASQLPFIMEIGRSEGVSMKELCTALGADKGLTTRVVRLLIQNGLVENRSEAVRTYRLHLTEKGREAFERSKAAMEELFDRLLDCLDEEEKDQLRRISAKLNRRLDEMYEY